MKTLKKIIRSTPVVREIVLFLLKCKSAIGYFATPIKELIVWLFTSREFANFTYDITDLNKKYLASLITVITGKSFQEISAYCSELENDVDLRNHIQVAIMNSNEKHFADRKVYYGRRLGWYILARAMKPRFIVETGVDKGMGSCVLIAALMKNEKDGFPGYYYGTDINPVAGYLLSGKYRKYGEILYGDSITSLKKLNFEIDLFINDSDHSAGYEEKEYKIIEDKLSRRSIVLGDNAHATDKLLNFALATNRKFVFFQEKPYRHWYPGAGIGVAYNLSSES
jgi:hypothetical protein